jgi:hypothetical protein
MIFKNLILATLLGLSSASSLRASEASPSAEGEHLDLELTLPDGSRSLFPLLPGTQCPAGHQCHVRTSAPVGVSPLTNSIQKGFNSRLQAMVNFEELDGELVKVVESEDRCDRRNAMARAAALAAGVAASFAGGSAYAAETKMVKMGTDSGLLVFEPKTTNICKGDSIKWYVQAARSSLDQAARSSLD